MNVSSVPLVSEIHQSESSYTAEGSGPVTVFPKDLPSAMVEEEQTHFVE